MNDSSKFLKHVKAVILASNFFFGIALAQTDASPLRENHFPFRDSPDQHGLGFGIIGQGSSGLTIFYDYNIHERSKQIHVQYDSTTDSRESLLKDNTSELGQRSLGLSVRHVYDSGWFLGIAGGWYNTTLDITQDGLGEAQKKQTLNFYHRGFIHGLEAGWQGNDFYYFSIGMRIMGRSKVAQQYDLSKVYDLSNHRSTTAEMWESGKNYSGLYVGFGWYLESVTNSVTSNPQSASSSAPQDDTLMQKAKKCQAKGGVWINDMCRLEVE
jgi:hypothetical protein